MNSRSTALLLLSCARVRSVVEVQRGGELAEMYHFNTDRGDRVRDFQFPDVPKQSGEGARVVGVFVGESGEPVRP